LGQTNFDEKLFVKMQNMATELIPDGVWIYNIAGGFAFEGSSLLETSVCLVLLQEK
jgi:hypothetical protein